MAVVWLESGRVAPGVHCAPGRVVGALMTFVPPRHDGAVGADPRAKVPRTDALLGGAAAVAALPALGRSRVKQIIGEVQTRVRAGDLDIDAVDDELRTQFSDGLIRMRRVLNGTGVLVHTNLGRAPLSLAALTAISTAAGTCDVELDLDSGRRSSRGQSLSDALLAAVPAAAGVHVVNNGAAAIALVAAAMACDGEIIISRGELIEIGAGFRIPDLLAATGARLREVGTTNRTHLRDYADAISADTRMILKVHPSNYRVDGFTSSVSVAALSSLPVPVVCDIGSGLLHPQPLLPAEPDVTSALRAGASVVTASGDKLLGGPQAGLIFADDTARTEVFRRHPMARAYRVDKLTLAALEATVVGPTAPIVTMLQTTQAQLEARAVSLVSSLEGLDVQARATTSTVGGGGAPGSELPSYGLSLPTRFGARLREVSVPVLARVEDGRCIVDLRAIDQRDLGTLADSIRQAASG